MTAWREIAGCVLMGIAAVIVLCALAARLIDRGEHSAPRARWRDAFGDLPVALRDLADDDGRDIADLFADEQMPTRESYPWLPEDDDDPEDVPRPGNATRIADNPTGPGYFHDDTPTAAIPSVRVQGVYLPLSDDTVIDITPYPRGGAAVWDTARPNPRVPARDSRPEWIWCGGTWTRLGAAGVPWLDTLFTAPLRMLEAAA